MNNQYLISGRRFGKSSISKLAIMKVVLDGRTDLTQEQKDKIWKEFIDKYNAIVNGK